MRTVTSKDGTTIAFDQSGMGPALILVGGIFEQRAMDSETAQLAAFPLLAQHFSVYHYDRRGRGDSTDTQPYALEREIEDIEALIDEAGGEAFVFGISSGAALAFEAALALGSKVKKLAMYEPPYSDDEATRQAWKEYRKQLTEVLAEGRRGDAVALFMMSLGVSADQIEGMRQYHMWPMWEAVAPTNGLRCRRHGRRWLGAYGASSPCCCACADHGWRGELSVYAHHGNHACKRNAPCTAPHPGRSDTRGRCGGDCPGVGGVLHCWRNQQLAGRGRR
jgi:pimeloyl-ACP methyl ester carboxylesterase